MSVWIGGVTLRLSKNCPREASTVVNVEFRPSTSHPGWYRTRDMFGCENLVPEENVALTAAELFKKTTKRKVKVGEEGETAVSMHSIPHLGGTRKVKRK